MKALTQSILSSARDCGLKALYTINPPAGHGRTAGADRAVGTGYHAALEHHYIARRDGKPLPAIQECVDVGIEAFRTSMTTDLYDNTPVEHFIWSEKVPDEETAEDAIGWMVDCYFAGGYAWPDEWEVLGVEVHRTAPDPELNGFPTKFGADLVLRGPDGGIVIDDQKTAGRKWPEGKEAPRKNVQAPFYQRLARVIWPGAPHYRFTFSVMTLPGPRSGPSFERREATPSLAHEKAVVEHARNFLHFYNSGAVLANPASTLCNEKWCDYWNECPYGKALD